MNPPVSVTAAERRLLDGFVRENGVTVVQLIYRSKSYEGGFKDYEFSRAALHDHWASGVADARRGLKNQDRYVAACRPAGTAVFDPGREAPAPSPAPTRTAAP